MLYAFASGVWTYTIAYNAASAYHAALQSMNVRCCLAIPAPIYIAYNAASAYHADLKSMNVRCCLDIPANL